MKKMANRRKFLLSGIAALALLSGQAKATIPLTMVDNGIGIPGSDTKVTGLGQSQSNSLTLSGVTATFGAPPAPGDLAIYYGCVNTSSTASGTQAIAAGPAGWTSLSGAGVAQISTTPTFTTRGIWWKVLTAADIATDTVSYSTGVLATVAASGMMIFRGGGNTFTLRSSGGVSGTAVNQAFPAKPAGLQVMMTLFCLRADLAEVINRASTPFIASTFFQNSYPGAMFAGAFFFCDPVTYGNSCAGQTGSWTWTTTSGGFSHYISIP